MFPMMLMTLAILGCWTDGSTLMLMMLAGLGAVGQTYSNDAADAGWFAGLLEKHVPIDAHDAGWFAVLLDRGVPSDAHVAGWFGGCWTNMFPMMLMLPAGLGCWTDGSLLMLMMLAGFGAVGQTCSQ